MLTRLKVNGFKNLVDVDIRFGPFTCIAGANGVGKSNLFDAITFLSALADRPLIDAALSVRDEGGRATDVRTLFFRAGNEYERRMAFEAEILVPAEGLDDLGQEARASITFLRYGLTLGYRHDDILRSPATLEVLREELTHINLGDARTHLPFPHGRDWRDSVVRGRRASPFITTDGDGSNRVIKQHQDGRAGRPLARSAQNLPRTVLSVANAAESPTALMARNEMRSWRLLQLEPSSLRRPDELTAPTTLGRDGAHLPATLYHLAQFGATNGHDGASREEADGQVYARVANRLSELIEDVRSVSVDRDEKRELLSLQVTGRDGTTHPARALSDGTLRFLALAVLDEEPRAHGLLCLEEPENGIHPARIPAMLRLLQDIATDVNTPIGPGNPLRQVIANTHSPSVVKQLPDDSLVVAELREMVVAGRRSKRVGFSGLADTWRHVAPNEAGIPLGTLLSYLNPEEPDLPAEDEWQDVGSTQGSRRRVMDRQDIQPLLPSPTANA